MFNLFRKWFSREEKDNHLFFNSDKNVESKTKFSATNTSSKNNKEDKKIYPFLARTGWDGLLEDNLVSIFHYDRNDNPLIYNTIVHQDGELCGVLNSSKMDEETYNTLITTAEAHLNDLNFILQTFKHIGDGSIVGAVDHAYVSEMILLPEKMKIIHKKLRAKKIRIAIPKRGVLIACDDACTKENEKLFVGLHLKIWNEKEEVQRICKDIFVLENGIIEDVYFFED